MARGRTTILENIDFAFEAGITVLLGPNGAGKTTLLSSLAGFAGVSAGHLALGGSDIPGEAERRAFQRTAGYMAQSYRPIPGFTAQESVEYAGWLKGIPSKQLRSRSRAALSEVGLDSEARKKVSKLSGGMRQRVGLAEAIVHDPEVLILDEPTVGLDLQQRHQFRAYLNARKATTSVLLSTHLTEDVSTLADRVVILAGGVIRFDGTLTTLNDIGRALPEERPGESSIERAYLNILGGAG